MEESASQSDDRMHIASVVDLQTAGTVPGEKEEAVLGEV